MLRGGDGNDTLIGDDGDTLQGGEGDDTFEVYIDSVISDNGQHLMIDDLTTIDDWEEGETIIIEYDPMHYMADGLSDAELAALEANNPELQFNFYQEEEGVSIYVSAPGFEQGDYAPWQVFVKHTTIAELQPHVVFRSYADPTWGTITPLS